MILPAGRAMGRFYKKAGIELRRVFSCFFALCCLAGLTACGQQAGSPTPAPPANSAAVAQQVSEPVYPQQLKPGHYEITVDSSASMFRVVRCQLIVEEASMRAVMTMSGKGYGLLYPGTAAQAALALEEACIPFVLDEAGAKTFSLPVEALNAPTPCAAWSIRKQTWYDRTLTFSSDALPSQAWATPSGETPPADGSYTASITLSGGSGRAEVASPAELTVTRGRPTATLVWSSPYYEYMLADGVRYDPVPGGETSTFLLPVALDADMPVSACTTAMSQPYLVEYTLRVDSSTLQVSAG